ncbi:hypothetical protein GCM10017566_66900 [Amycolatopsis bartoniae]|uniref:IS30 family transposase n=1 Tax=Amycolatopsis bartoniae TaxID=941986 RepID=A0A8H9J4A8_9PSEU|nr:hypothetical protein GCM10017566_66900 [Amycolatopsis bartoniae]
MTDGGYRPQVVRVRPAEAGHLFPRPALAWQRSTNENTNGLLRQYFPKFTDLSGYHPDYLELVAAELNNRPRKRLGRRSPAETRTQRFRDRLRRPTRTCRPGTLGPARPALASRRRVQKKR